MQKFVGPKRPSVDAQGPGELQGPGVLALSSDMEEDLHDAWRASADPLLTIGELRNKRAVLKVHMRSWEVCMLARKKPNPVSREK